MPIEARMFFLQAITPVHVGAGQSIDSVVDLPVMRERATGHPIIPASALKGVLRDGRTDPEANQIYGAAPDRDGSSGQAARLVLTDARLLFLPVRSFFGTYALITSPTVLYRWQRDAEALGCEILPKPSVYRDQTAFVAPDSLVKHSSGTDGPKVILEDLDLDAEELGADWVQLLTRLIFSKEEERRSFTQHLAIVDDAIFDFFARSGLEVRARVQLEGETKTVKEGPWYEEVIPAEAIFVFIAATEDKHYFDEITKRSLIQLGGQASIGRGLVRLVGGVHGS